MNQIAFEPRKGHEVILKMAKGRSTQSPIVLLLNIKDMKVQALYCFLLDHTFDPICIDAALLAFRISSSLRFFGI